MTQYRPHQPRNAVDDKPDHLKGWDPEHFTACGIIIRTPSNKILVSRRADTQSSPGCWQIPGGKANPNEEWVDAAVREAKEETGLVIAPGSLELLGDWTVKTDVRYRAVVYLYDSITEQIDAEQKEPDKAGPWQLMPIEELEAQPEAMIAGLRLALKTLVVPPPAPPPPPAPEPDTSVDEERDKRDEFLDRLLKPTAEQIARTQAIGRNVKLVGVFLLALIIILVTAIVFLIVVVSSTTEKKRVPPPSEEIEGGTGNHPGDYK